MNEMTLREVCDLVGVSRRAVQGYEKEGLVTATGKNKYGYLLYDEAAVRQIQNIKMYRDFGFKLKDIKMLMVVPRREYEVLLNKRLVEVQKQIKILEENVIKMKKLLSDKR